MSASSAAWKPVGTMSAIMDASATGMESGRIARFPSASLTWKSSPKTPSLKFENFQPASMPPECIPNPACASRDIQSGVIAGTITRSPGLKSFTREPTSTTSPTASCPRIMSVRSPIAPSHTVWISELHGATASGFTSASSGPHLGASFSIHPISPILRIASPLIFFAMVCPSTCLSVGRRLTRASRAMLMGLCRSTPARPTHLRPDDQPT